jgi:DNA (cytosine-5)-methyltransferase 1
VPPAAVDENCQLRSAKNDVGLASETRDRSNMNPISKATAMELAAEDLLWHRVLASVRAHDLLRCWSRRRRRWRKLVDTTLSLHSVQSCGFDGIDAQYDRSPMPAPTFIDLFSGAGGLTLGLEEAGWKCLGGLDSWGDAVATYKRNLPSHPAYEIDIKEIDAAWLAKNLPDGPDWVVGGPPCQGWSTVGKRLWDDERNELFTEFMRVVRLLQPRNFLIENVLGLKDMGAAPDVRALFAGIGYEVSFHVVRAADFGVPQLRRRVIFVGDRGGLSVQKPVATSEVNEFTTVWDAIGDLPFVGPGETATEYDESPFTDYQRVLRRRSAELQGHTVSAHPPYLVKALSFIPDGGNRTAIPVEYQPTSGWHNTYSRLNSKEPAVAITSNLGKPSGTRCVHPFQHRGLTAREGARLQSFPDEFHFEGGIVSQRLQIANAVPPMLARALGESLDDVDRRSQALARAA